MESRDSENVAVGRFVDRVIVVRGEKCRVWAHRVSTRQWDAGGDCAGGRVSVTGAKTAAEVFDAWERKANEGEGKEKGKDG
jgi:hypothetical protein